MRIIQRYQGLSFKSWVPFRGRDQLCHATDQTLPSFELSLKCITIFLESTRPSFLSLSKPGRELVPNSVNRFQYLAYLQACQPCPKPRYLDVDFP